MNIHEVTTFPIVKPRDFIMISKVTLPKIWRNKRKRHKIINMQKLWRRDYNFNVNKDQPTNARFYKNIRYERVIFYHLGQLPMI